MLPQYRYDRLDLRKWSFMMHTSKQFLSDAFLNLDLVHVCC